MAGSPPPVETVGGPSDLNPRVEYPIGDVDEQVDDEEENGGYHDGGLDDREIAEEDGIDHQLTEARPGKDGFGDDCAAQQGTQLQCHEGNYRRGAAR